MNKTAKMYIYGVLGLGTLAVGASLAQLHAANPALFALLAALATIGAALKIRVPGVEGNLSLSFLPMILSSVLLSIPEAVLIAAVATLVQSTAFNKKRKPLQIAFNCAALALSVLLASLAGLAVAGQGVPIIQLALAAGTFYVANSVLVTTVIGLAANRPVGEIWNECLHLYLPYFATGLACAMAAFTGSTPDERRALEYPGIAVLPLMLLARQYFKHSAAMMHHPSK